MKLLSVLLALIAVTAAASSEQSACTAAAGTFMTGKVVAGPRFASGSYLDGVELSHTHITVKSDANGKSYDIAIDNVYAAGYDQAGESVPDPLSTLVVGTHVELCGETFSGGMHWVHSNCNTTPSKTNPDGWVKVLNAQGVAGPNLEDNQEYCYLWGE